MWDQVKPITLFLEQENDDKSRFLMYFYSFDYELVKLNEAMHFGTGGELLGGYSRLLEFHGDGKYDSNFFVERLTRETIYDLIQYYENKNLTVEYLI
jgi:hypothetical protein